jgi:2-keto-4-pentenoate hydratase
VRYVECRSCTRRIVGHGGYRLSMAALPPALAVHQQELLDRWRQELATGAVRVGWKLGHAIPEVQAIVGEQPVIGYLSSRTLLADGEEWSRHGEDIRAETEFGVELRCDLQAGATSSEAAAAIAGLCVALEIVDVARSPGDIDAVMRGNVFHRAVVFGPTYPFRPGDLGPASLRLDGTTHEAGEPVPDPVCVVQAAAEALAPFGETLRSGDRVLSGSFVHERLGCACAATAAIENLGHVSLVIREPR